MRQPGRTLILAFDGTSNEFDDTNTNVVKLCAVLDMSDRGRQMVYYQPGIGTYTAPSIHGMLRQRVLRTADLAVAWCLSAHITAGYTFLMENHVPGDSILLFGFSRGAYTARALAGMLHSVGLLPKGNHEQVAFAYRMYRSQHHLAGRFKATFCKSVEVEMLGVWDTVASVGFIVPQTLPFVSNNTIKVFRHAVSLDERRTRFGVTLWKPENEVMGCFEPQMRKPIAEPRVKEMWFAGGHGDVGGGDQEDVIESSLANISFRWMLHEIQKLDCGVVFDNEGLDMLRVPTDCVHRVSAAESLSRIHSDDTAVGEEDSDKNKKSRDSIPSWQEADHNDAKAIMHDQLKDNPLWYLLQSPFKGTRSFPVDDERREQSSIHPTVLTRMESVEGYSPGGILPADWKSFVCGP
ncbi:hypothetical protein M408DRAFT_309602 [Serendipita vermifera MAFF 305830]|uniref:T6SS Phospholipase effector Tle1-like catalytic domain-containing protein n=1 Tax=Serendipita vermifera MAFF 305830 TaxID=933852 RepID=A0A0C2XWU4_SERVB|nr:hypothetical protein M408DRAFT_309602 [Serendipita vermifera MAFF 305830]